MYTKLFSGARYPIRNGRVRYLSNTVSLHYDVIRAPTLNEWPNDAPNMMFLHGLYGSSRNWKGTAMKLSQELKLNSIIIDARNHGDSPHHPVMTTQAHSQDIMQFLEDKGLNKIILLGHSMGGKTAMFFALHYPHQVDKLIVVDIAPVAYHHNESIHITSILKQLDLTQAKSLMDLDKKLQEKGLNKSTCGFLLQNVRKNEKTNQFEWKIPLDTIDGNLPLLLQAEYDEHTQYNGDTLFISGKQSKYIVPEYHPIIYKKFPKAIIDEIDAGHLVHFEKPNQFIDVILNFFKGQIK